MIEVRKEGVILEKTENGFENDSVLNPAVIYVDGYIHLFYRAVRTGNYSTIGHCTLDKPTSVIHRDSKPLLFPENKYESQGLEDPRIVKIEDIYYLTYSVYDKRNVFGAFATSKDLVSFKKNKIITPKVTFREYKHLIECCPGLNEKYLFHYKIFKDHGLGEELSRKLYVWDKNILFFPEKIDGKFALLHRIYPGIQLVLFENFQDLTKSFWDEYLMNLDNHIVMDPKLYYESGHIGGGCPPIKTEKGWLLIYHAVENKPKGLVYHASAALLDIKNPRKEIARLKKPLFSPEFEWEKEGVVSNVVFPSGAVVIDNRIYIYYGAADLRVAVASVDFDELLNNLLTTKI